MNKVDLKGVLALRQARNFATEISENKQTVIKETSKHIILHRQEEVQLATWFFFKEMFRVWKDSSVQKVLNIRAQKPEL